MATAEEALDEAKRLMPKALGSTSTKDQRLVFFKQLIKLASYKSHKCRSFMGTLIAKFFAEFEELQDEAVDALLDLCEDDEEKTRIIGIQGLASTGRADPRWVRGNTGVLLQLLGTQPRELRHVKESLQTLIKTSSDDVYEVMAENCLSDESETGVSKSKIIEFLQENDPKALDIVLNLNAGMAETNGVSKEEVMRDEMELDTPALASESVVMSKALPTGPSTHSSIQQSRISTISRSSTAPPPPSTTVSTTPSTIAPTAAEAAKQNVAPSMPQSNASSSSARPLPKGPANMQSNASRTNGPTLTGPEFNRAEASSSQPVPVASTSRSISDSHQPPPSGPRSRASLPSTSVSLKAAADDASTTISTPSLASRIGSPTPPSKRAREEPAPGVQPSQTPSLLSRLSSSNSDHELSSTPTSSSGGLLSRLSLNSDSREPKRIRESPNDKPEPKTRSLLDRIQPTGSAATTDDTSPRTPGTISMARRVEITPISRTPASSNPIQLSILNRSTSGSIPSSQPTPQSLTIRNRSSNPLTPSPATLSIRNHSSAPTPSPKPVLIPQISEEDDGIVRKGRGFKRDDSGSEDIIVLPPVSMHLQVGTGGGSTPSLGMGGGRSLIRPMKGGLGIRGGFGFGGRGRR